MKFKIRDKVLVEMEVVGMDKITGDYHVKPEKDNRTFWASERMVHTAEKTYEDGLREAWETARLIEMEKASGGLDIGDLTSIFGTNITPYIFRDNTAQEAAAKIAEWEEKQEIRVGDVLEDKITGKKVVVSCVKSRNRENVFAIYPDGSCGELEKDGFTKTGRTIDIAALLAQIGGIGDER